MGALLLLSGLGRAADDGQPLDAAASPLTSTGSVRFFGTGGAPDTDRIKVPVEPSAPADVGAGDMTVEFWLRGTKAANMTPTDGYRPAGQTEAADDDWIYGNIVVDRDIFGGGPDWGVSIHRDAGRAVLRFGTDDGVTLHTLQGAVDVLDGGWHHVALLRERASGQKRIVVDGILDAQSAPGASAGDLSYPDGRGTAFPQSDPFLVFAAEKHGFPGTSAFPSFAGWLDEIRVWSVARGVDEIAASRWLTLPPDTPGLVLHLPLDEGVGHILGDPTGGDTATLFRGIVGNGEWTTEVPSAPPATTTTLTVTTSTVTTASSTTSSTTSVSTVTSTSATTTSTASASSTTSTTLPAADGLVAAYGFEEAGGGQVVDSSGNGNVGTTSGATRTTSGRYGAALAFDGVNDWVTVNDASVLDLTTAMTLEAWVFPTTTPSGWRTIVAKELGGGVCYYLHAATDNGNRPATGVYVGADRVLYGTAALAVNTWTHLAATYDGQQQRLYVNGVQVASRNQTGATLTSTSALRIGGNGPFGEFFAGRIDEVRVYNRVLTATQIQADMSRAVAGVGSTSTTSSSTSTSNSSTVPTTIASTTSSTSTPSSIASSSTTSTSTTSPSSAPSTSTTSSTTSSTVPTTSTSTSSSTSTSASSTSSSPTSSSTTSTSGTSSTTSSSTTSSTVPTTSTSSSMTTSTLVSGTSTSTTSASSTTSTTPPAALGLVAAYGFEEANGAQAVDASGSGNTGTVSGATRTPSGRFGSALVFDGVNDWVTINDANSLDLTTAMTLEAWVFPAVTPSGWRTIIGKEASGRLCYYLHAGTDNANRPAAGVYVGADRVLYGTATPATNTWTHLAATYDGQQQRLYVNGVQMASRAQTGASLTSTSALRIGGNGPFGEFFAGRIDEVRLYNRVLTATEILADSNRAVAGGG